jgi:hypothetical protein
MQKLFNFLMVGLTFSVLNVSTVEANCSDFTVNTAAHDQCEAAVEAERLRGDDQPQTNFNDPGRADGVGEQQESGSKEGGQAPLMDPGLVEEGADKKDTAITK